MQDKPLRKNEKVLVCQMGARHRYAVPRLLEEAGLLAALYTDSCRYSLLGRLASGLQKLGIGHPSVKALAARNPSGISRNQVRCTDASVLSGFFGGRNSLTPIFKQWGVSQATTLYSMYGEEVKFLEWVKRQGVRIIVDVFVHPSTNRIVAEEECRLFGRADCSNIDVEDEHSIRVFEIADILLCPSSWVAEGVREFLPGCAGKIRIVPYGSSLEVNSEINPNVKAGRILFVGREPLRKGLHYLAEAAHRIRQSGGHIEVRAAGVDARQIQWMQHRSEIRCLERLPMDQMHREYEQADLFVLPSLSEGQAGVILEAMACGCPVVATRESGVDLKSGCGITVPARNPEALVEAIQSIVGNREKRNQLARGALRQAADFSMEAWKKRLVHVIEETSRI